MKGFTTYIYKFMEKAQLLPGSGKVALALSGGRDSMALLHVLVELRNRGPIKGLRAFHVNHGTRPENAQEEALVREYCLKQGVSLEVFHPALDSTVSNFEHFARAKRYELFFNSLQVGEVLFTAHHIDDSFEWSLLKQFKSSSPQAGLGIPVKNGRIRRPFNCVTKTQIANYVRLNKIPFIYDSSNDSIRFERNFIREKIIPQIAQRFPGYLKHFAYRSNQLALKWGVSSMVETKIKFHVLRDSHGILIAHPEGGNDFRGAQEQITKAITSLSEKKRGTLSTQVEKIIQAAKNGKKGPLLFSGNVFGFINHDSLYFMTKKSLDGFKQLDEELLASLENKKMKFRPISYEGLKYSKGLTFPFLTFAKVMPENIPSLKKKHPLFPKSTEYGIQNGLWVNTLPRLLFHLQKGSRVQLKKDFSLFNI